MAITLGKDCFIRLGGVVIASAKNVTLSESARTIEVNAYGSRLNAVYSTGYECTATIELNDPADIGMGFSHMHRGTAFEVTGGAGAFSFPAIVTGITETDPIDGVATVLIEARLTHPSLMTRTI